MTKWQRRRFVTFLVAIAIAAACSSPVQPTPAPVSSPAPPAAPAQGTYTLTAGAKTVAAGGELTVSWTASQPGKLDWIAIYRVTATNLQHGWYDYVDGANSGTFTIKAPTEPGLYEFRYLIDDSYFDVVKSASITVEEERP